jgi:hypothetical protein
MTVFYEWDVEEFTDDEYEDIVQHFFCDKFSDALAIIQAAENGHKRRIVLVRDDDTERSWAYLMDDGTMPEFFENANGAECGRVPKRFKECAARAVREKR